MFVQRDVNRPQAGSNQDRKPLAYCLKDACSFANPRGKMTQLTVTNFFSLILLGLKLLILAIIFSYLRFEALARPIPLFVNP